MIKNSFISLFHFDPLAIIMISLVAFIGMCVGSFAYRYMRGDKQYRIFFIQLSLLITTVAMMVSADHLAVLFPVWCISNLLLVRMMVHKSSWKAALASGRLATKNYTLGAACMASAFTMIYYGTGQTSIQAIVRTSEECSIILPALVLLLIGAMTQSAIWPFHRWLTSSLNSPTPVSAIMHAGLVNGGGFLLTRFAPLYLEHSTLLTVIFAIGLVSALLGTLWKLMQSDVKRMLACSTMGQMGFMLIQCGLGLFPAAVAHLVWHGMFKAYLFLASGGAAQEKRFDLSYPPNPFTFICALICGVIGSIGFSYATCKSWFADDTTLLLMVVAFLAASQFALSILCHKIRQKIPLALAATILMGLVYGSSVRLIEWMMEPMLLMHPQPLNALHIAGIIVLTLTWLLFLFIRNKDKTIESPAWILKGYVKSLNASQPHPPTVTTHRNHYQYL
jgi:NAD(P)H-quinone oxidoreductase subunit 5